MHRRNHRDKRHTNLLQAAPRVSRIQQQERSAPQQFEQSGIEDQTYAATTFHGQPKPKYVNVAMVTTSGRSQRIPSIGTRVNPPLPPRMMSGREILQMKHHQQQQKEMRTRNLWSQSKCEQQEYGRKVQGDGDQNQMPTSSKTPTVGTHRLLVHPKPKQQHVSMRRKQKVKFDERCLMRQGNNPFDTIHENSSEDLEAMGVELDNLIDIHDDYEKGALHYTDSETKSVESSGEEEEENLQDEVDVSNEEVVYAELSTIPQPPNLRSIVD